MPNILIIDDEVKTAAYLKKGLEENGFVADIATDGDDGFYLAINRSYDLVILDVMLPGLDGWQILSGLHEKNVRSAVLMLTARDAVCDRVKGLELRADDYLVKPFSFYELLARVRNVLRHAAVSRPDVLRISDLDIDPVRHKASRAHVNLDLSPKEFSLLYFMAVRAGNVLSRTVIAEHVWGMNFDCYTNVVDVAVRRLRAKVDDPFAKKLIHTVRGVGYILEER
ncbi:MAG: heavy metal response regulator transcription factor [Nitrospiraceae bacterium]|nr:heavy metal response regulator transcription factor [Nitrospiraceae bacterium]